MFSRIASLFSKPVKPIDRLKRIANAYDERGGEADTLQGLLANAMLSLRSQANRDGWQNWGSNYEEYVEMLLKYLCDEKIAPLPKERASEAWRDLEAIREAGQTGADHGRFAYEECDRMVETVLEWCESHPRPIHKATGQDFW